MSKIALSPNASGTGTFTFAAPGTNTDRTLTLPDATGTIFSSADIASQAQAEAGTDNTTVMTPLRTKQAVSALASVPAYTGTETTPTTGTSYTFTHGLGRLPHHVQVYLRCATASNGFSVDDYLLLTPWHDSTTGVGIWFTTTSIVVRTGAGVGYIAPSGYAALTLSNFRLNVQAW
jgi:hypothetical protein